MKPYAQTRSSMHQPFQVIPMLHSRTHPFCILTDSITYTHKPTFTRCWSRALGQIFQFSHCAKINYPVTVTVTVTVTVIPVLTDLPYKQSIDTCTPAVAYISTYTCRLYISQRLYPPNYSSHTHNPHTHIQTHTSAHTHQPMSLPSGSSPWSCLVFLIYAH